VLLINEEERVNKILLLDTETNDLNGFAVSIALIQLDLASKKIDRTYYKVINPKAYINPESIEIHGITPEMVENAPTFQDIFEEVDEFVRSSDLLCAFNAIYDVGVLVREYERVGKIPPPMPYLDAMKRLKVQVQAKNVAGKLKDPKLSEAADFFGIQYNEEDLHNALDDTQILTEVFIKALQSYE
jgi:DNA polymerase-3 subunit epsilon